MFWYIVRRLLQGIPVFFGSTFLIYAMVFAMPGNPILRMFGDRTPSPEQVAALEDKFNLDQPFFVRYFLYLGDVFQGNLGTTFSGQSVNDILIRTFPTTLRLALLAVLIQLIVGVTIGIISALRKGGIIDVTALGISLVLISLPVFVFAFARRRFGGQRHSHPARRLWLDRQGRDGLAPAVGALPRGCRVKQAGRPLQRRLSPAGVRGFAGRGAGGLPRGDCRRRKLLRGAVTER